LKGKSIITKSKPTSSSCIKYGRGNSNSKSVASIKQAITTKTRSGLKYAEYGKNALNIKALVEEAKTPNAMSNWDD
jgi:hypothetical protein